MSHNLLREKEKIDFLQEFINPKNNVRPKMRWWLPGAFMDNNEIKREIRILSEAGYGGAEILHFYPIPTAEVDLAQIPNYYFGSEQWNDRMKAALEAAIENNFTLDFTIGPLWPIATPAVMDVNDDRCVQGLHIGVKNFTGSYNGVIPDSETIVEERPKKLIAVTAARVNPTISVGKLCSFDINSAVNLMGITGCVDSANNTLNWKAPDEGEWYIFSFWSQSTGQMNGSAGAPALDHFSKDAVAAVTQYWEENLFRDPELLQLYEKNAGDIFCDSIELNATMLGGMYGSEPMTVAIWTANLLVEFRQRRGYDLSAFLPTIFVKGLYQMGGGGCSTDTVSQYEFAEEKAGHRIRNDFFQTLTELFNENHLVELRKWPNSHNMKLRYQIYGLTTDITSGVKELDVVEHETWGAGDNKEFYRLLSGAAHMTGKDIYSLELGARPGLAYRQTWTGPGSEYGLLWEFHRALAAGINQAVLHGMSYNTTSVMGEMGSMFNWPGLSLMGSQFSNEWGDRQPIWNHSATLTNYMARNQLVLRKGQQKVDLAVYRYGIDGATHHMVGNPTVIEQTGYSYDYVSPLLLSLENAKVGVFDGVKTLTPEGPAYKALVIDERTNLDSKKSEAAAMPLETIGRIIEFAKAGLPIVIVGEPPKQTVAYKGNYEAANRDDFLLKERLEELLQLPTVRRIKTRQDIKTALESLGVTPSVNSQAQSDLLGVRRAEDGTNYYFLYNQSENEDIVTTVSLVGKGKPYTMDAWSGKIYPIAHRIDGSRVIIDLRIAPNSTVLIAITETELSEEKSVKISASEVLETISINDWQLEIESWTAGETPTTTKKEMICLDINELKPWSQIEGLEKVSGIGKYSTTITLDSKWMSDKGVYLSLGKVCDTVKISVNGSELSTVNQIHPVAELGSFLKLGENNIEIEVASTLNNALRLSDSSRPIQEYGLMGPVYLCLIER
jgi:hypothetical protein